MELSDLYSQRILDLAANAPQPGRLAAPHASSRKVSRVCGSMIEVDLQVEDGVITGYGQAVSACALGQTSAAVVAREIVGTRVSEFRALCEIMAGMLQAEGPLPEGKWEDLRFLEPVREYKHRHGSTMLVFDAVVEALEKIDAKPEVAVAS